MTRRADWLAACAVALAGLTLASAARAQLRVEVLPVFGESCAPRSGPTELVVGITNPGAASVAGTARIATSAPTPSTMPPSGVRTVEAVPFAIGPRASATVRVPTPPEGLPPNASLRVEDTNSGFATQQDLRFPQGADAIVVDATPQGRAAFGLRGATTPDVFGSPSPSPVAAAATGLTPCPAMRLPATGDVVLPRSLAGYTNVAMVLIDAGSVMALPVPERMALADYVLTGGTVTIIPSRPDELRHPTLAALLGSGIVGVTPPPLNPAEGGWMQPSPGAMPGMFPAEATLRGAQSFRGGNLNYNTLGPMFRYGAPELLGASADYGAGHLHVLSFNPAMPPAVEDPWALTLVAQLAQQARGGRSAQLLGDAPAGAAVPSAVRQALDPNQEFRPGLGLAAILLVLYAVLAGPVSFRRAARRGRPERGLALLPVWSAVLFAGIVALGVVSRGWQGRARRFGLVELPAGMARGPMRRFHGYYSGDSGGREVRTRGHDRRLYADPAMGTGYVTLTLERDGATLSGLATTAWTTAVVREEGQETLRGTVTIQPDARGVLRVVNRLPYALRDVLVLTAAGAQGWAFREIAPRAAVLANTGAPVPPALLAQLMGGFPDTATGGGSNGAPNTASPGWQFAQLFNGGPEGAARWNALLALRGASGGLGAMVPTVVAMLAAPVPDASDGGLRVDQDTEYVRVVGYGGEP